eukprot:gene8600-9306_t
MQVVSRSGDTFWTLTELEKEKGKDVQSIDLNFLQLKHSIEKNKGIFTSKEAFVGNVLLEQNAVAAIITGSKSEKLCHQCYSCIEDKDLSKFSFPSLVSTTAHSILFYCSQGCLDANHDFHHSFKDHLTELSRYYKLQQLTAAAQTASSPSQETTKLHSQTSLLDLQLLLYKILHKLMKVSSLPTTKEKSALFELFDLFIPPNSLLTSSSDYALLFPIASSLAEHLQSERKDFITLAKAEYWITIDADWIFRLLLILQYNCQTLTTFPPLTSSDISITAIFPIIARINHSCQPNVMLFQEVVNSASASAPALSLTVRAIRKINADEELTMSYLQESSNSISGLSLSYTTRQQLLSSGFQFTCQCERCEVEKSAMLPSSSNLPQSSVVQVRNTLEEQLKAAESSGKILSLPDHNTLLTINKSFDDIEGIFNVVSTFPTPSAAASITSSAIYYEYLIYATQDMAKRLPHYMEEVKKMMSLPVLSNEKNAKESLLVKHYQSYFSYIHIILRAGIFSHQYNNFLVSFHHEEGEVEEGEREEIEKNKKNTKKKEKKRKQRLFTLSHIELMISITIQVIKIMNFTKQQIQLLMESSRADNKDKQNGSTAQLAMIVQSIGAWSQSYLPTKIQQYRDIILTIISSIERYFVNDSDEVESSNRMAYRHVNSISHYQYLLTTLKRVENLLQSFKI